jgi:hypothetical protein
MTLLILRPTYDQGLEVLINSADFFILKNKHEFKNYIDKKSKFLNKNEIEELLIELHSNFSPIVIYMCGHDGGKYEKIKGKGLKGSPDSYVLDDSNIDLLKGCVVFSNICHCLDNHGEKSVKNGAFLYAGYNDLLWVPPSNEGTLGFNECYTMPLLSYIELGADKDEIMKRTLEIYDYWKKFWSNRNVYNYFALDLNSIGFGIK